MKILFIVESYYPKTSGVPVVVQYLAEGLVKLGNKVTVVTKSVVGQPANDQLNGVEIVRFDVKYNRLRMQTGDVDSYISYVKNRSDDVIIFECCQCITTDILLPYLKELKGLKLLHSHGFSGLTLTPFKLMGTIKNTVGNTFNYLHWNRYYSSVLTKYINDFDATICLSEIDSSKNYIENNFRKNLYVLGNAADDMFFLNENNNICSIENYTNIQGNGYFLSVANYSATKNQIGILEEYYKSGVIDYDMVFIGSRKCPYYNILVKVNKKFEKRYGKRNVHFLLGVKRTDISQIVKFAKLYLVGSTFEEFSISIIEAMSQGVPFISTNTGNARILPGGVTIDSIQEMSNNIKELVLDDELYQSYSVNALKYSNEFCKISYAVNKLLNIVEKERSQIFGNV